MVSVIMFIVLFSLAISCFILSFKFRKGQWLLLVAGYNDLPKNKREKIDKKQIGNLASKSIFVTGIYLVYEAVVVQLLLFSFFENKGVALLLLGVPTILFIFFIVRQTKLSGAIYKE